MNDLISVLRVAALDLRGGLRRFLVLLACLALGTGTIATVGSVGGALQGAVTRDARAFLGGDLEGQLSYRGASDSELATLRSFGTESEVIELSARAGTIDATAFLAVRAVDAAYPLVGRVVLSPDMAVQQVLAADGERFGAAVDQRLLDRLGIGLGDEFAIGTALFVARAVLVSMPDDAARGFQLGAPVLISGDALRSADILGEGVLARYRYKLLLDPGVDPKDAADTLREQFSGGGWQLREPQDAATGLRRFFDLFSRFLVLVGLSTLIVGGVGVANAVTAYIDARQAAIATMRSLGATGGRILLHFLFQILVLSLLGIGIGLVLGAAASLALLPIVGGMLKLDLPPSADGGALLVAAAFGLAIAVTFSILPLARARSIRPALLFRAGGVAEPARIWRDLQRPGVLVSLLAGMAVIAGLAVLTSQQPLFVAYYAAAMAGGVLLLRLAAWVLGVLLRLLPPPLLLAPRLALGGINRNRAAMATIVTSLGLGLTLLLLIALIEGNLRNELSGEIATEAPSFVLFNIDKSTLPDVEAFATTDTDVSAFEAVPVTRGVISKVAGTPSSELGELPADIAPLFNGDQALSWSAPIPEGSEIVAGEWWPETYDGPPLVSLTEEFGDGLNLALGDTLEVTIAGRPITATIASFRHVDARRAGADFPVVFSPGLIEQAPATFIATMKVKPGSESTAERELARAFPDVAIAPVGEALDLVAQLVGSLANAVATVGGVAVASGMLVLAGALSAGRQRREAEAVVMKVLGATRGTVLVAYLIEYGLLGALATLIAAGLGVAGAWAVVTGLLELPFSLDPARIVVVLALAVAATMAVGLLTTWSALSVRPAARLRDA